MNQFKVAFTEESIKYFKTNRNLILAENTDFTDVAVAVLTDIDEELINKVYDTKFGIPIFVVLRKDKNMLIYNR